MVCSAPILVQHFYTSYILVWDLSKWYVVPLYMLNIFIPVIY